MAQFTKESQGRDWFVKFASQGALGVEGDGTTKGVPVLLANLLPVGQATRRVAPEFDPNYTKFVGVGAGEVPFTGLKGGIQVERVKIDVGLITLPTAVVATPRHFIFDNALRAAGILKWLTVGLGSTAAIVDYRIQDCKVNSASLSFTTGEFVSGSLELLGGKITEGAAGAAAANLTNRSPFAVY